MTGVLAISLIALLAILTLLEYLEYDSVFDIAEDELTVQRLQRTLSVVHSMELPAASDFLRRISHCHDGYSLSARPYAETSETERTKLLQSTLSQQLSVPSSSIQVGYATLGRDEFAYHECRQDEMSFPVQGMVISVALPSGNWLNAEVHPHEWHVTPALQDKFVRSGIAFLLVGTIALVFVRRLSRPLQTLADSASDFASGLEPRSLQASGPLEVRRTIKSFNVMQRQVAHEMKRRTAAMAAISHDLRSPLTALRLKAEMIDDETLRAEHVASIDRMERITASALAYLKGEARNEPKRTVDLGELVESECAEFQDIGGDVIFDRPRKLAFRCRPDALGRAVHNVIDNALKYAGSAEVSIATSRESVTITVVDSGPGIPASQIARVMMPFEQFAASGDEAGGGFGLGLAIAKALVEGHDGELRLSANRPTGLIVTLEMPMA